MAMAALRLRRHRLLADPTRVFSIRIEPIRRTAAAASFPSQLSLVHPHRTPSPCSTPSAASIDSHCTPSPRPIHFVPSSVTLCRFSPPRSTFSPASVGYRRHSAEEQCDVGLLAAVEEGPRALPRWRNASSHPWGNQAARRILSAANPRSPQGSPANPLLGSGSKRFFSSTPGSSERGLPPVSQLMCREDRRVMQEEWVDPIQHLEDHSLVVDTRNNHLNLEIPGFGDQPRYNFSDDTGIPLFQSLIFLALINNNRGYCVKNSFRMDNLLLCPELKQFRFKKVYYDDLDPDSKDFNRAASYSAAERLIRELLQVTVGPHAISCLLEEPRDLLSKMAHPSDQRLITYHPSLLSTEGRIWFYLKLYRFYFRVCPLSTSRVVKYVAKKALSEFPYTSPSEQTVEDIIQRHSLLAHIDSKKPTRDTEAKNHVKDKQCERLGKCLVSIHRHTVEHAFDKEARQVQSKARPDARPRQFWMYSLEQVVDMLRTCFPLYLLKVQECFVKSPHLWAELEINCYWPRDLTWMGGVPEPTKAEIATFKPTYGQRRKQARKFDEFNRGTNADTAGDQDGARTEKE